MNNKVESEYIDPYKPLAQSLKSGDSVNRWILSRPRQVITHLLRGQRVLDVCCGTGTLSAMLASVGCQVTGVDSSATMLSFARNKHIEAEFHQIDAAELSYNNEFDAAVISLALHEMPPVVREKVWEGMSKAVRPDGRLIAMDYAIPIRNTLAARFFYGLAEGDEREMLKIHPEHYYNFREFMQNGGLLAWVKDRCQPIIEEYHFWGGIISVIVSRQPEKG